MENLDDPARITQIREIIARKGVLQTFYRNAYERMRSAEHRCSVDGISLELGSGGGFLKEYLPQIVTSDIIAYPGVDQVLDATRMPFADNSLRFVCMLNTLHHIPDARGFFAEIDRCLRPGGRIFMIEPYPGWIGYPVYRWVHHEPFEMAAKDWKFESHGPLSSANGALPWIIFERDRKLFENRFPKLALRNYRPNSPMYYWIAGGLKKWALLPGSAAGVASGIDRILEKISPRFSSFVDIEIEKIK